MRNLFFLPLLLLFAACQSHETGENPDMLEPNVPEWALVVHGGAGYFDSESYTDEEEAAYRDRLTAALDAGEAVLAAGGSSTDAVVAAIQVLENSPLFNAGKGAVFTAEGINEMDASIMRGSDLNCGAVTGIQQVKNPITAARAVMEHSEHVFFSGGGATLFAQDQGLTMVDSSYFWSEKSWYRYMRIKANEDSLAAAGQAFHLHRWPDAKFGTVGCVALDKEGNLAAGTSTGGMTFKRNGRIGDSPVIAAGTYADNNSAAISCTGHGEFFIRTAVAHDICARVEHGGASLEEAARAVVMDKLVRMEGEGGIIGLDHHGNVAMTFNSAGMFRGFRKSTGETAVKMYGNE